MNKTYSISEISKKYNISTHTLKYYEDIDLIKSLRNKSNYRVYDRECLEILEQVLLFRRMGISVKNIKMIFAANARDDIMGIINSHKARLKKESSVLDGMRENIAAFITQIEDDSVQSEEFLRDCGAKRRCEIDLAEMRETSSNEGRRHDETEDLLRIEKTSDGDVLLISSENKYVVSEEEYTIPILMRFITKTNGRLCLFFGGYRSVFMREKDRLTISFHDHVQNCDLTVYEYLDPAEGFVEIKWLIKTDRTSIYLNEDIIFSLDYVNNFDFELTSKIGIGAVRGNKVTVKNIFVHKYNDERETDIVSLPLMKWRQSEHYMSSGELVFYNLLDLVAVGTPQRFTLPLRIDIAAKTDDTNLRIYFHNGQVIFNWERNKLCLHMEDILTGEIFESKTSGYITPNEFHEISWIINTGYTALTVDGVMRFYSEDMPYIAHSRKNTITDDIRISSAFGSTVTIKSLVITELE